MLFVCTANICRSPWMELTGRQLAAGSTDVEFASAGTHGFTDHPMDEVMAATLPPGAADSFRSRRLDRAIVDGADLVLTAEAEHAAYVVQEFPAAFRRTWTVGQFAEAVERHPGLHGRELLEAVGKRRPAARREHDVRDPYRRGAGAARDAAGTMSTMLSVIVPRLLEERE